LPVLPAASDHAVEADRTESCANGRTESASVRWFQDDRSGPRIAAACCGCSWSSRPAPVSSARHRHRGVQRPMTVNRALALIALAGGAVLSTAQLGLACDCHDGGPVCEAFWKTPVVFVGRVEAIEALRTTSEDSEAPPRGTSTSSATARAAITASRRGSTGWSTRFRRRTASA
jgi:hypothetical protein